jgi:hypothetical protein
MKTKNNKSDEVTTARIVTHWRRFSCGLWRVPQGDISAAYSAECFPKVRVFTHEGRLYSNEGGCSRFLEAEADCYALIPLDEYSGPSEVPYSYEGREATYRGKVFRLGPKTKFVASDPTVEECRRMIRVCYADGGYFASRCTYSVFLTERFKATSPNSKAALAAELAECQIRQMPQTQDEMRRLLAGESNEVNSRQLDFGL